MPTTNIETEVLTQGHFKIKDIGLFITRLVSNILIISAIMAFGFLLWGAVNWIMSQGDKAKVEEARNRITAALMGLALVAVVYLLWRIAIYFLGIGDTVGDEVIFELE